MKRRSKVSLAVLSASALLLMSGCAIGGAQTQGIDSESDRPGAPLSSGFSESVVAACSASSPTLDAIRERGSLNWGIGVSPPFGFKTNDGNWAGVEPDNARELAALLGVKVEIQDYDYGIMTAALQSKKADIVGAILFITPERSAVIDFSDYYYLAGQLFYILEDSPYQTIDDLNQEGVRFVYGTGNAQLAIAEKYIPKATITDAPLRGQLLLYEFLATDKADASMVQAESMKMLQDQYTSPQLAAIGMNGRVTTEAAEESDIIDPFEVAFGLPPGDAAWKTCVDGWVNEAKDSGRMEARIQYWQDEKGQG